MGQISKLAMVLPQHQNIRFHIQGVVAVLACPAEAALSFQEEAVHILLCLSSQEEADRL